MLDAMLESMAAQPAVVVVDEIQNAEPEAVSLLTRMAGQLADGQRLLRRHATTVLDVPLVTLWGYQRDIHSLIAGHRRRRFAAQDGRRRLDAGRVLGDAARGGRFGG